MTEAHESSAGELREDMLALGMNATQIDFAIERIARTEAENARLRGEVQAFHYGDNYIKQFKDAKDKCSAMYPPEEVYTESQLDLWAQEHGYLKGEQ